MIRQLRLILWFLVGVVISFNAVLAFAGDRHPYVNGEKPSMEQCKAAYAYNGSQQKSACVQDVTCPDQQDGGACNDSAHYWYNPYTTGPGYTATFVGHYSYCSNDTPKWDGAKCIKDDPCKSKSGQSVDDGSLDFGDGANKRLSMSFPDRDDNNYVGQTFCSGGCMAAVDKQVGSMGISMGGNYYGQFTAKFNGNSCPADQPPASPKTKPALIPKNTPEYDCISKGMAYGYVGETVKCVAKTSSKETEQKTSETTKADGSKVKETKTDNTVCSGGVCVTTTTTTTTEYNSSGAAVGTTTKTDTTTKADPNSGLGSGGAGSGKEGQGTECGIAGKPPCGVKVDETDVKTDVATVDQRFKDQVTAAYDEVRQKMEQVTRPQNWGVTWVYAPPAGACSVLQYGTQAHRFSIDICKPLGYIRDLWSYVIYVMTGLYIWRSARDAMNIV